MRRQRMMTADELAQGELLALAREWNVLLSEQDLRSYATVLAAHNQSDVHEAFRRIRVAGQGRSHTLMPLCYSIVLKIREVYRERIMPVKCETAHVEVA